MRKDILQIAERPESMTVEDIRARLAGYRPALIEEPRVARAAVAMVLRGEAESVELLLIQRATRDGDPWSGHIAFPGGRRDPGDPDVLATAMRETQEEVGIDLRAHGVPIGRLDDLRAVVRGRPLDLVISPIVFALRAPVALTLAPREVESAVWAPLTRLASPAARTTYHPSRDGIEFRVPAVHYERYTIWGLTHRMLERFLEIVHG